MRKPRHEVTGWQKPYEDCESSADLPRRDRCNYTVARCNPCVRRAQREMALRAAKKAKPAL